jgi:hypothetical protein
MTANEKAVFIRRADINETTRKTKKMTEINFTEEIYQRTSALYSGMTVWQWTYNNIRPHCNSGEREHPFWTIVNT